MNMQAIMKQAQAMQKKMMDAKAKIDAKTFVGSTELVTVKMNGKREILSVELKNMDSFESDDIELLQDMIKIATNDALTQIDKELESTLGSQSGLPGGLF